MRTLGGHLKGESELVSGLVQLGSVQGGGQGHQDALTQLLLVAQTNLKDTINLKTCIGPVY